MKNTWKLEGKYKKKIFKHFFKNSLKLREINENTRKKN